MRLQGSVRVCSTLFLFFGIVVFAREPQIHFAVIGPEPGAWPAILSSVNFTRQDSELAKIFVAHTPLGRAGTAEDIVGPAIFLASDLSAYVSGSIVMVDGGYRTV